LSEVFWKLLQKERKERMALMPDEDFEGDFLEVQENNHGISNFVRICMESLLWRLPTPSLKNIVYWPLIQLYFNISDKIKTSNFVGDFLARTQNSPAASNVAVISSTFLKTSATDGECSSGIRFKDGYVIFTHLPCKCTDDAVSLFTPSAHNVRRF
jgi:hypothetical protein